MPIVRVFWTVDTTIGHLPAPLANLAAGLLIAGLATAHAYIATGAWLQPGRPDTENR